MFYSAPWSSHPRSPFPYHPVVGVYPGNYSSNVHNWQWNNVPYVQPLAPYLRNESVPVHRDTSISKAEAELNQIWRMLWEQHVAWTRMVIISIAASLPDEALVTERLLRNAPDMAAVIRRYYGEKNASRFSALMKEHFVLAAQLVKAAKAGNNKAASEVEKKWYANADEIVAFLSSINPNWPKPVLRKMLHEHLRLLKDEAVFRLSGNYKSDIEIYDQD
ncbi:hypothetical protein J2Z22_003538 [Paenibacillus forsythiae]|uniref:Acetylglutamate kinase n=1 Tax=Paenibacillus forsythiae TaxID=365616 RepID=A0ABU3HAV7_9BACL|nr:hypothetical protein [Paenibacillus forsythiae]MDT3427962.1 hypothetical protein [Paenibacillus forsythiae]